MDHANIKRISQALRECGASHVQVIGWEHLNGPLYLVVIKFLVKAPAEAPREAN